MQGEAVYDRVAELKAFDETKTGVKGLVDMAVTKVPRIFVLPPGQRISPTTPITDPALRVPTLDISTEKLGGSHRQDLVEAIRAACETWGFFQVVGHDVPMSLMERVIEGIGAFNEGAIETKTAVYSREPNRAVKYSSNFDLYQSPVANWRDTLYCRMAPDPPSPAELPADCRWFWRIIKDMRAQRNTWVPVLIPIKRDYDKSLVSYLTKTLKPVFPRTYNFAKKINGGIFSSLFFVSSILNRKSRTIVIPYTQCKYVRPTLFF